ncbi:MAG: RsmE family RNA methyltransferase [Vicinamibacterales bacterium]
MHRCYAPHAARPSIVLSDDEAHHVTRVLRLGVGAEVAVFDGRGGEWLGRIADSTRSLTRVELVEARVPVVEPAVSVTVAISLLKADGMNNVIRDVTMLGAAAIVPLVSAHVAGPDPGRRTQTVERWARVAVASSKQCGRAVVPDIRPLATLEAVLAAETGTRVCCVEPSLSTGASVGVGPRPTSALVCVGPEGGWSDEELACAHRYEARLLALGPRTLRAEAAPTVALSVLWTCWGWS